MVPVPYRVTGRRTELPDTATLALEPIEAGLAGPRPGQFHMLWAFGVGEVPISVSHLQSDRPGTHHHTVRAVGATTRALCALAEGDTLGVRGPFGHGWDLDAARGGDVVVVAGGLGLAPLRPVVEAITAARDSFGRVAVLVGARSPDDLLFADVLAEWRGRFDLDVEITVDHARGGWHGDVGVVTSLVPRIPIDVAAAAAFVCGPEIMMRFAGNALRDAGVAPERIQVSLERNMVCAVAHCGHCQLGPTLVCRDGPVYTLDAVGPLLSVRSL
ncbi:MAG TPA: FAD/NAD(P)-binding protein [Acidimicrobiales bacterium]|nr:FAD/NAD(P)-binding protein [Acidimicrobiales bacterium]